MRIAVLAPLVSPIAEPHIGGSQALLSDLAVGLAGRGHEVRVYAATGSHIDGVDVVDTGVDAASLRATLFRADGAHADSSSTAATEAFRAAAGMIAGDAPDVVHARAFDAPSVEAVASLGIPWIQVLHLPPDAAVAGAVGRAVAGGGPHAVVTVSEAMRSAWAAAGVGARVIRPGVPVERIPWRAESSRGVLFAGRLSPEKGALDGIAIATGAGMPLTRRWPSTPRRKPGGRSLRGAQVPAPPQSDRRRTVLSRKFGTNLSSGTIACEGFREPSEPHPREG